MYNHKKDEFADAELYVWAAKVRTITKAHAAQLAVGLNPWYVSSEAFRTLQHVKQQRDNAQIIEDNIHLLQLGDNHKLAQWAQIFAENGIEMSVQMAEYAKEAVALVSASDVWPWGSYTTNLLDQLAKAAKKFWANPQYDPNDPTTAPTNQAVIDYLKGQGVTERTAQIMATILRADGLPPGPRK
jgi:hypothetical protein